MKHLTGIVAVLAFVAVAASPTIAQAPPWEAAHTCSATGDHAMPGGTEVECDEELICLAMAELFIHVKSGDSSWGQPVVSGSYTCGDMTAVCPATEVQCMGVSLGLTKQTDRGPCKGKSDEFWSSPVTVTCASGPGISDPPPGLCDLLPELPVCREGEPPVPLNVPPWVLPPVPAPPMDAIRKMCEAAAENAGVILSKSDYDALFSDVSLPAIDSLSTSTYFADKSVVSFLYLGKGFGAERCDVERYQANLL